MVLEVSQLLLSQSFGIYLCAVEGVSKVHPVLEKGSEGEGWKLWHQKTIIRRKEWFKSPS